MGQGRDWIPHSLKEAGRGSDVGAGSEGHNVYHRERAKIWDWW